MATSTYAFTYSPSIGDILLLFNMTLIKLICYAKKEIKRNYTF